MGTDREEPFLTNTEEPFLTDTEEPFLTAKEKSLVTDTEKNYPRTSEEPLLTATEESPMTAIKEPVLTKTETPLLPEKSEETLVIENSRKVVMLPRQYSEVSNAVRLRKVFQRRQSLQCHGYNRSQQKLFEDRIRSFKNVKFLIDEKSASEITNLLLNF